MYTLYIYNTKCIVQCHDCYSIDRSGGGREKPCIIQCICIGYTLGSQCIPGIYARWFLIMHEGVISKPPRVFPGIHGYLGYNQFVG